MHVDRALRASTPVTVDRRLREAGLQPLTDALEVSPTERLAVPQTRDLSACRRGHRKQPRDGRKRRTADTRWQACRWPRARHTSRAPQCVGGELAQPNESTGTTGQNRSPAKELTPALSKRSRTMPRMPATRGRIIPASCAFVACPRAPSSSPASAYEKVSNSSD
jgi:hypothetical protein